MSQAAGDTATVQPLDSFPLADLSRPLGLYLTLDAGQFQSVTLNTKTHAVNLTFTPAGKYTPEARLRIEQPAKLAGIGTYAPAGDLKSERDAFIVPLAAQATTLELMMK